MTLILLFCMFCSVFTVAKATQNIIITGNDTDILHLIESIQKISNDKDVILLTKSSSAKDDTYEYTSDYEETGNKKHYHDFEDDEVQSSKEKNILRWLPKKRTPRLIRESRIEEKSELEKAERNRQRARAINDWRVAHVSSVISKNFWTTLYLHGEVRRILQSREVIDDIRALIQNLELEGNEALKEKVLKCYRDEKRMHDGTIWKYKTNNLVIQIGKDPLNDGRYA